MRNPLIVFSHYVGKVAVYKRVNKRRFEDIPF